MEQLFTISIHQTEIKHDGSKTLAAQGAPGTSHAGAQVHGISTLAEVHNKSIGDARIVFDYQYPHDGIFAGVGPHELSLW
jgi:hypothetical protein